MSQLVRQKDTTSLVRNGNFGSGLSFWKGAAKHDKVIGDSYPGGNLVLAPHYVADIEAGESISQVITRSDVYAFPSRRYVTNATMIPFGLDTYKLLTTSFTRVDGIPVTGNTFLYSDEEGIIALTPGQQIELADQLRVDNGGHYRVGQLFDDGGVEVSPIQHGMTKIATQDTHDLTISSTGNIGTAVFTGQAAFDRQLDDDDGFDGFQVGDVIVINDPAFALARITSVSVSGSVTTCQLARSDTSPFPSFTGGDPVTPDPVVSADWFVSTPTSANFQRDLSAYQYSFTLGFSHYPAAYDATPTIEVIDRDGSVVESLQAYTLDGGSDFESLSLIDSGTTSYLRRLYWFFSETRVPHNLDLRLTIPGGAEGSRIGDVVLYKGKYTGRHDYDDRDDPTSSGFADQRSALDRMIHGTDEYECAIPKGTVIMYAGGPVCPPGFKAVDGLVGSSDSGTEMLPVPDSVQYDIDRNRTIIEWADRDFPVLDDAGRSIPIPDDAGQVQVTLPAQPPFHGALESILFGPTYQRTQPGMTLRIKSTNEPGNTEYDFSTPIRQAFVDRREVQGNPTVPAGSINDITYPAFYDASQFDAGEVNFDPIGPDESGQPTSYSPNTAVFPFDKGTIANPARFSGLTNGAASMTFTGVGLTGLEVGEVVYVRWSNVNPTSTPPALIIQGSFLATIQSNQGGNVSVVRADGNSMVVDGTTGSVAGFGSFSDPKVFGPDTIVTRTNVANMPVWSARRFKVTTAVTVFGDVTAELATNHPDGILLEPSGFVRYGSDDFDLGDMGHSHLVTAGDAELDKNVAPYVSAAYSYLSPTRVAREHGHGYFAKHHHVIPRFFAVIPCVKM